MLCDLVAKESVCGMKKILILGANGFIGKNLKYSLEQKYNISVPTHSELDVSNMESVRNFLSKEKFDVVIHSANTNNTRNSKVLDYEVLDKNLRMFFNLESCSQFYEKMIYFGSGAEYDMKHYIPGMKEEYFGKYIPTDPYGFSKYIMSKVCEESNNIFDLRLFGVYGKYEEWERRFISNAICRALVGKDITIQKNVFFDYLWVDDLCKIVEWYIENTPSYKHYNVCRGSSIDLYSLACMVREILNIDCDIVIKEEGWKPEYSGNNERLLNEIGEIQFTSYEKSIEELCEYYRNNIYFIDKNRLV